MKRFLASLALLFIGVSGLSAQVVISQVYGGGGNAGATIKNDFIEIFNRGNAAQDLTGWSVQYGSSGGTTWAVTNLAGTLQAGQYFLIQEAVGAGGTVNLPTPDATGTIAMSATAGKVALVNTTTALTGACATGSGIQDFVGYGGANCSEGSPTAALTNTTADLRAGAGCTDNNTNSTDFSQVAPSPRNTASPLNICGAPTPLSIGSTSPLPAGTINTAYSFQFVAVGGTGTKTWVLLSGTLPQNLALGTNGVLGGTPIESGTFNNLLVQVTDGASATATATFSLTINAAATCTPTHLIGQIQGTGSVSPAANQIVTTQGIVTGRKSNGFFLQSRAGDVDADPNTSEGVFVFTSSAPGANATVGNFVCVTGTVQEFVPDANGPSTTEIAVNPAVTVLSTGNALPTPVVLTAADLNPAGPLDVLERFEGMRVKVDSLTAIAPTQGTITESSATSVSNGVFYGVITGVQRPIREAGVQVGIPLPAGSPAGIPRFDFNPERLRIDSDALGAPKLEVTSGAVVTNIVGTLDFGFYTATIDIDPAVAASVSGITSASPSATPLPEELTVATLNLERFFDTVADPSISDVVLTAQAFANRLNKASLAIRNSLNSPDILAVEEMENLPALQALANKINTDNPALNYSAYLVEGNDIGGIDAGFLVNLNRVTVVDVTQYGKTATYLDPNTNQQAIIFDRPPLVLRARAARPGSTTTVPITVMALHLRSLSGVEDVADGRVRSKRKAGAEYVANLVQSRQLADPLENIVVLGDFNAFDVNDGYVDVTNTIRGVPAPADQVVLASPALVNPTLTNVLQLVPIERRYSYSFDGDTQFIDQILVNQALMTRFNRADVAHNNADFPESFRNDPNRPERISDHDMPIAYFTLPVATAPSNTDVTSQVSVTSTGLAYSRVNRTYSGTITITNTSGSAINAPIQFVLTSLTASATLQNATGATGGNPYITAQATGTLAPGASINVGVVFSAPAGTAITYTPQIFSGVF